MLKNNMLGLLIAVDGPNGVGKTTIIRALYNRLNSIGYISEITKEPSDSNLGQFLRKESEKLTGTALACLVAANRYEHIEKEIKLLLKKGLIVLGDRYVLSSLILQGMDGVNENFIMNINNDIIMPDIQIVLQATENVIHNRLTERTQLTRFERGNKTNLEMKYLEHGVSILKQYNIPIYFFNTEEDINDNVKKIIDIIILYLKEKGKIQNI